MLCRLGFRLLPQERQESKEYLDLLYKLLLRPMMMRETARAEAGTGARTGEGAGAASRAEGGPV